MRAIDKLFYGQYANKNVDFDLYEGEVHSLLGENGAGKTTLMNCLAGIYMPDGGSIYVDGSPVVLQNPRAAIEHGIGMVHQHFMLVPVLTVWENIVLGQSGLPFVINKNEIISKYADGIVWCQ